jgi:hypothetical protein
MEHNHAEAIYHATFPSDDFLPTIPAALSSSSITIPGAHAANGRQETAAATVAAVAAASASLPAAAAAAAAAVHSVRVIDPSKRHNKEVTFGGHGWMGPLILNATGTVVSNDLQVFAGMDQEVYRKTNFHEMTCSGKLFWRRFWAEYGMGEEEWEDDQVFGGSRGGRRSSKTSPCRSPEEQPWKAIHRYCCNQTECLTREESQGRCCSKRDMFGLHHCKKARGTPED